MIGCPGVGGGDYSVQTGQTRPLAASPWPSHVCAVRGACLGCGSCLGLLEAADPGEPQRSLARSEGSARDGSFPVRGGTPGSLSHPPGQRRACLRGCLSSAAPACGWVRAGPQVTRALLVDSGNWPVAPGSLGLTSTRTIVTPSCLLAVAQRVPDFIVSKRYRPGGGGLGTPAGLRLASQRCSLPPLWPRTRGLFLRGGWQREPVYSVSLVVWDCGPQTPPVCGCGGCVGPGARGLDRSALQS